MKKRGRKFGHSVSEETRRKISQATKAQWESPEGKSKLITNRKGMLGKKHTDEYKQKMKKIRSGKPLLKNRGENNPNWKGGITPINQFIRTSLEYKLWRESVFERDNYTCVWCGARSAKNIKVVLHADHIKPFAQFPELRFAIDNGRTLCIDCHRKTDTFAGKNKKTLFYG